MLLIPLLWSCTTTVKTRMLLPARAHEAARFSRVAVLPFSGNHGRQVSSEVEAIMVSLQVEGKPFFKVIERSEIDKVAREHEFQMSGSVDETTAASFGKMLGAEAVVLGTVNQFKTEDVTYRKKRRECTSKDEDGKCNNYREYSAICTKRTALFQFTPKFVDVETSSIAASEPMSGKVTDEACSDSGRPVSSSAELMEIAQKQAMDKFQNYIAPHYVSVNIVLITSDASGMDRLVKDKIKQGTKWANSDRLDRACEYWKEASELHKTGYAIPYLLGVCHEIKGEFEKAKSQYEKADSQTAKPVGEISQALLRIRRDIKRQRQLDEQVDK